MSNVKREYRAPVLVIYGRISLLTASGTQAGTEGPGVGNGRRRS